MPATVNNLNQVNPDNLFKGSSVKIVESSEAASKLRELKAFIEEMLEAISSNQDSPVALKNSIKHYEATLLEHYNNLLTWVSQAKDNKEPGAKKQWKGFTHGTKGALKTSPMMAI